MSTTVDTYQFFAACPHYSEALLREELSRIIGSGSAADPAHAAEFRETSGGVGFRGSLEDAYRVCLWSQLAGRVYLELATETIADRDGLYNLARSVAWHELFELEQSFAVASHTAHPGFRSENLAALIVKDAVADHFRERTGKRPSVDTEAPDARLYVHLTTRSTSLYLDLSGESLHQRGYRLARTAAPLRENTAAAVLARAGWFAAVARWRAAGGAPPVLVDPMCGAGTLAIEAGLAATDGAPGLGRPHFGFERSLLHDAKLWASLRTEAENRQEQGLAAFVRAGGRIWASDIDPEAISACNQNADRAGMSDIITTGCSDFSRLTRGAVLGSWNKVWETEDAPSCFVVTNPPYGVRIGPLGRSNEEPEQLYAKLGAWLASNFEGARAAVLAESKDQARALGLRADKVNTLYNGRLKIVVALLRLEESNRYVAPLSDSEQAASEDQTQGTAMLLNRLRRNAAELKDYLNNEKISCYRLYDADIPQYSAAVDLYTETDGTLHVVVQEYAPPASIAKDASAQRFDELLDTIRRFLEPQQLRMHIKQRRRQRGDDQYRPDEGGTSRGSGARSGFGSGSGGGSGARTSGSTRTSIVEENGLAFETNFKDYIDTGLFLDHRDVRRRIRDMAKDKHFLNLFAYTCTASVYAADGGARTTVSVDTSNTYLDWGRRNFQLNQLLSNGDHFVRRDCMEFIRDCPDDFDLIFIDPPSFSNSKGREDVFDIQLDHEHLLLSALELLTDDGTILFSTNLRGFVLSDKLREVARVGEVSEELTPPDFARRKNRRHVFLLRKL